MNDSQINKYLTENFSEAIKFYDDRACKAKRQYRCLSIGLIIISALLTPIIPFVPDNIWCRIVSIIMSASIVIATGLLSHLKCHENWLSYRSTWDALKREHRFFETGTGPYKSATNNSELFVERVETILTKEGADFYALHAKGAEQTKKDCT